MTYLWIESVYGMGFLSKNLNCRVSINGYCATACWKEEVERKVSAPISRSKLTLNNPCSYTPLVIQDIIFPTTTIHCFGMIYISAKSKADFELINKTSKLICWKNLIKKGDINPSIKSFKKFCWQSEIPMSTEILQE